jgi:hypothetical protein
MLTGAHHTWYGMVEGAYMVQYPLAGEIVLNVISFVLVPLFSYFVTLYQLLRLCGMK